MSAAVLIAQATDLQDALVKGGPFALGAGAVLLMGRLGWIRFPPSPEQTADKARLEALTDDLISKQATALVDAITSTRDVTRAMESTNTSVQAAAMASAETTRAVARLTEQAESIRAALAGRDRSRASDRGPG